MARRSLSNPRPAGYSSRPIVLDLFCGAGGAAFGYVQAGYRVIGIDTDPLMLKRYPWECYRADALTVLAQLVVYGCWGNIWVGDVVLIHASPPCEAYSKTARIGNSSAEMLIEPTRYLLQEIGKPYIIENVEEARSALIEPVMLCGAMFPELRTYRHRLFETSFVVPHRPHARHTQRQPKMGRPVVEGDFIQVVGHFSNADYARRAMGIEWMGRDQLKEAIPPAYTRYISHFAPDPC